jgi:ABC-type nickel/cobalt efflux system permease component RcnA
MKAIDNLVIRPAMRTFTAKSTANSMTNLAQIAARKTLVLMVGCWLSLSIVALPKAAHAHAGHDHEFSGGNAEQVMQPLSIDTNTATALGIKTAPIAAADQVTVMTSSVVDINGSQLVYVQTDGIFKPVPIQAGKTVGDRVEIAEGNLKVGDQVVIQGAPLLYSEALRRKPQNVADQNAVADQKADHEHGPHTHTHNNISPKKLALGLGAGTIVGAGIVVGLSKLRRGKSAIDS